MEIGEKLNDNVQINHMIREQIEEVKYLVSRGIPVTALNHMACG